jgi:endonuclease-8
VHRLALQFERDFVGRRVVATSPQGRFAPGAALLDACTLEASRAVGKQLFLGFRAHDGRPDDGLWLRIHLGMYGAWDFYGRISPISSAAPAFGSIGAPRARRAVRIAEYETALDPRSAGDGEPPAPVGQVRLRLLAKGCEDGTGPAWSLADLRGPSACEVLDADAVHRIVAGLGPDPLNDDNDAARERFVAGVARRAVPIGRLLMDQSVVSGIGNVYRAELLFRAGLDPFTPGRAVHEDRLAGLWADWSTLLARGVSAGIMLTRDEVDPDDVARARQHPDLRHWVYRRQGEPCRRCGTPISMALLGQRKLYWCMVCQA